MTITIYGLAFGYITVDLAAYYGLPGQLVKALKSVLWLLLLIFLVLGVVRS